MSFSLSFKDTLCEDILGDKLMDLAGIVFRKHYYASVCEKDDLISVGALKALALIRSGNFSENKGTLLNYLYTGMRNEMHNYLYHQNKKMKCEDVVCEQASDLYFEDDSFHINLEVIYTVCDGFKMYGDCSEVVATELASRGFVVGVNMPKREKSIMFDLDSSFKHDLVDRLCGAVLWKSQEFSH